jgi:hypothetical protein
LEESCKLTTFIKKLTNHVDDSNFLQTQLDHFDLNEDAKN